MDPDKCLEEIRKCAAVVNEQAEAGLSDFDACFHLAEHVAALDEWISKGGFLPAAWKKSGT